MKLPVFASGQNLLGHLGAISVVMLWGTTFVSSKVLLNAGLQPADIFFYRFSIAYICLLLISHKKMWADSLWDELTMVGLGIMGGSLYFLTENMALIYSTTANVSILVSSCPLLTALVLAIFYKSERLNGKQIIGSLIAFVGVILVVLNGQLVLHLNPRGDLLALTAALTWAFYSLFMKHVMTRYSPDFITRKVFGYGLLTILPYFLLVHPLHTDTTLLLQPKIISNLLFLGLLASTGGYLLWNWVMQKLGAMKATNYLYSQTLITMVAGHLILGEPITWMALFGASILIAGTVRALRK